MEPTIAHMPNTSKLFEVIKDLAWGSLGGLAGTIWSHPFDTIRIRLQLSHINKENYKGIIDWANKTFKVEGFFGLYKGIFPPILFQCPTYALLFAGKEFGDRFLTKYTDVNKDVKSLFAGAVGGIASTIISCPAELLKIRSQNNVKARTSYFKLARKMYAAEGWSAFYKGYFCTIWRDVPAFVVYFGIFEMACRRYLQSSDSFSKTLLLQILFGSIAGVASWWITYPFDIVKSVIQWSDHHISIRQAFLQLYKEHGAKFFVRGLLATSVKAVPMEATWLVLYTQVRNLL